MKDYDSIVRTQNAGSRMTSSPQSIFTTATSTLDTVSHAHTPTAGNPMHAKGRLRHITAACMLEESDSIVLILGAKSRMHGQRASDNTISMSTKPPEHFSRAQILRVQ